MRPARRQNGASPRTRRANGAFSDGGVKLEVDSEGKWRSLRTRALSAAFMVAGLVGCLLGGHMPTIALIFVVQGAMVRELFGPVLTVYVYDDARWEETLDLVDSSSPYALTGAVFATDRSAVDDALGRLRHAAGNFYINDKPTGAVVGQQPFGGARASGTNDKAGSPLNLLRWVSPRSIKETFVPPTDWRYPHQG